MYIPAISYAEDEDIDISGFKEVSENDISAADGMVEIDGEVSDISELPSSVDLRDRGIVTPVKYQNPFGTCWGFAAVSAAETSILSSTGQTYEETGIDLSEHHLAYFAMNAINDPENSQNGEGTHWLNDATSSDSLDTGGELFTSTSMFACGMGPAKESAFPYHGKDSRIYSILDGSGNLIKACYSNDDDWSIDESSRFVSDYELTESYQIQGPEAAAEEGGEEAREKSINYIKYQVYKGIGQSLAYHADISQPGEDGNSKYLNYTNWCQYTPADADKKELEPNHGVSIVGYDDDYPVENFNENYRPERPGAFLCKNSWGSQQNEFPHKGVKKWGIVENGKNTGYFWLSYYDASIDSVEGLEFSYYSARTSDYRICDQYSYMPSAGNLVFELKNEAGEVKMANVFTAEEDQELYAVSFETESFGAEADYEIFLLDDDAADPYDGEPVCRGHKTLGFPGYHRVQLENDQTVFLERGQKYSVVVREKNADNKEEIVFPGNYTKKEYKKKGVDYYIRGVINRGESFVLYNGKWYDWADASSAFIRGAGGSTDTYITDNFAIRAYCDPAAGTEKEHVPAERHENRTSAGYDKVMYCRNCGELISTETVKFPFDDVNTGDWFFEDVFYSWENGLVSGVSKESFAPGDTTTRAMIAALIWRMEGSPEAEGPCGFNDVEADSWYEEAVIWAASAGIVKGVSDKRFAPDRNITREQLASMLYRYAWYKDYDVTDRADISGFSDAGSISGYAVEAIEWAYANGIIKGTDRNRIDPKGTALRAQAAAVLHRFIVL